MKSKRKRRSRKGIFRLKNTFRLRKNKRKSTAKPVRCSEQLAREDADAKKKSDMVAVQWELPCCCLNLSLEPACFSSRKLSSTVACCSAASFCSASLA